MTSANELLASLMDEARALDRRFGEQAQAVRDDDRLSDQGKREKLQELEAERAAAVEVMVAEAQESIDAGIRRAQRQAAEARRLRTETQRAALGMPEYAALLRAQVAAADADELVTLLEQATDSFDHELVLGYGLLRLRDMEQSAEVMRARIAFDAAVPDLSGAERERSTLERFDLSQLDRRTHVTELANVYGVSADAALTVDRAEAASV